MGEPGQWKKTGHSDVVKTRGETHFFHLGFFCGLDQLMKTDPTPVLQSEKDDL